MLSPVLAQAEVESNTEQNIEDTATSADFTAELIQQTQDPGSKEITFIMRLTSQITASRVQITWELTGGSVFTDTYPSTGLLAVQAGQTYNLPIRIRPTASNVTELFGSARAVLADGDKIATVRINFATNAQAEILPLTDEYLAARTEYRLVSTIQTVGIVTGVIVVGGFILLRFMKYLNRDDVKAYDRRAGQR